MNPNEKQAVEQAAADRGEGLPDGALIDAQSQAWSTFVLWCMHRRAKLRKECETPTISNRALRQSQAQLKLITDILELPRSLQEKAERQRQRGDSPQSFLRSSDMGWTQR